ncbi:MAG: amidohydrolase [Candidatus Helarchaeota archaeon]|nr:amidohydrolase [Candidatus Helarchaeota archaeon]
MKHLTVKLFYNCEILTLDQNNSKAEAMAIFQDKILEVGIENHIRNEINQFIENYNAKYGYKLELQEQNLGGACVVPGFIDAHMHPGFYVYKKTQLDLSRVKSYAELHTVLQQAHKLRQPGECIVGLDLIEDTFENLTERHFPDRYALDKMCLDRPVFIFRHDGHICSVNSIFLKQIGIDSSNVKEMTPESGEIRVDPQGNPIGIFTEKAAAFVLGAIPIPNSDRLKEAGVEASAELASFGITTCGVIVQYGNVGIEGEAGAMVLPLLELFIKEGLIKQDYVFYISTNRPKVLKRIKRSIQKLDARENRFVLAGIKTYADGSFGASTACLFEPFADSPDGATGFMVAKKEELHALFKEAYDLGFQIACHAIGDKANRIVVDVFKDIIGEPSNESPRCRIEHASLLTDDILTDASNLGIIMVCQPAFINSEYTWLEKRLGSKRLKYTYPFRSIIDAGIILAGASDAPVESVNVFKAISACVTRHNLVPEQAITVMEALRMFTYNAAYALGQEDIKGSLERGKLADFVVLKQNPEKLPPDQLGNIKILKTYHRGTQIFQNKT